MAFQAKWDRKRYASNQALVGTAPDPAHAVSAGHDVLYGANPGPESWEQQFTSPGVPGDVLGEGTNYADARGGGGPVDRTPVDHTTGVGTGAGLTDKQSSDQNEYWHEVDYGATEARRWNAPMDVDGHNVAERVTEPDPIGLMGSLNTVELKFGTNKEAYPNTRPGSRIHRWRDRVYDRRTFTTDHRPLYTPNAWTAPNQPGGDSQYVSPYPLLGQVNTVIVQAPQVRRVPQGWGEPVTTDGSEAPLYAESSLDVWGL